jgi:site-specific DNA-methyltransferase (adenine-specific)
MKPYFNTNNADLYHGDAVKILNGLDVESVDLIFADPPYNLSNDGTTCHAGKRVSVNKGKWDASRGIDADFAFHSEWIAACRRVLKPNGSLWISGTYHSIYACGFALQQQGWHLVNDICWYKPNAAPNLACRMFTASHETLLWARTDKKAKHYFNYDLAKGGNWEGDTLKKPDKQMRSVWVVNPPRNEEKRFGKHPTQKPEALLERIILTCSREGDVVLDPFCGSGTTGVVALRHHRSFIGIDTEKTYLDTLAIPRMTEVLKSLTLFR